MIALRSLIFAQILECEFLLQNILNFYRREVIKPDGSVDIKKHKQFVSQTDKGGYGYGLRKFFYSIIT